MKRVSGLWGEISDLDNLKLAFWKARRGKTTHRAVRQFQEGLDENLEAMRAGLMDGTVALGNYRYFTIQDPKVRLICAASFPERVLHHAVMNLCEPVFEKQLIFDSYACRAGKGTQAALRRAMRFHRRGGWFLKMDIRKYFDSITHERLLGRLARLFKDPELLHLFERLVSTYQTEPGKGLPIGNLTSQHFANFYLSGLDHFIKNELRVGRYLRYMDDFILWASEKEELLSARVSIEQFLHAELALKLKAGAQFNRTREGVDFLGFRLNAGGCALSRSTKARARRKFVGMERSCRRGELSEADLQVKVQCLFAHLGQAASLGFRRSLIRRFGEDS
jgi:RNA-directed DNA polymerase